MFVGSSKKMKKENLRKRRCIAEKQIGDMALNGNVQPVMNAQKKEKAPPDIIC